LPANLERCVDDVKGQKGVDDAWAICSSSINECEVCNGNEHQPTDHPYIPKMKEISPLDIIIQEHHSPLDIPFGYEVKEVNKNVKDVEEGGTGSGRNPEDGEKPTGSQAGPLVSFETVSVPSSASNLSIGAKKIEETVMKQLLDSKLTCPCNRK